LKRTLDRADHKANGIGGPAPVTNGGTAMLVMRNFGYLGLHTVVDSRSSLARDRLVDFTGEFQLRRRTDDDKPERRERPKGSDNYRLELPDWHPTYIAEPAVNGGRCLFFVESLSEEVDGSGASVSKLYAQELAPLPLMLEPSSRLSTGPQAGMALVRSAQDDIEPFYHTSFCNELLCHPRILHNCQQGHISIKVELREMEWNETVNAYFAHVPRSSIGPSVHNTRRGPFLVQSAFTSCTSLRGDHQFIDEFKIKLPLDLNPRHPDGKSRSLSLFFTVFRVKTGSKSKWKRGAKMLFGSTIVDSLGNADDADLTGRVEQVACGFLPLTSQSCLLDNGMHDVRVAYRAQKPPDDMCKEGIVSPSSIMLADRELTDGGAAVLGRDESFEKDTTASNDSLRWDRSKDIESSASDLQSLNDDSVSKSLKSKSLNEPIALSVSLYASQCCDCACRRALF
jgi:hypothetical protein